MVTREDVLKFLKALDDNNAQNRDFEGNVVGGKSVELRKEYCKVYLDLFENIEIQIWENTTRLIIKRNKPWPTPDEMVEYIGKVETAYRAKQNICATSEPMPVPVKKFTTTFGKKADKENWKERRHAMFELARQGKFKEAATMAGGDDIRKKALEYGKMVFPDADSEWYEENISALRILIYQQEMCNNCEGLAMCRYRGYSQAGVIDKAIGTLNIVMMPCMLKKVESAEDVSL